MSDESSFAGRAIEQSSTDRTDYRFPLAILSTVVATNVLVSVKFKSVSGHVDQAGGIPSELLTATIITLCGKRPEDNVQFYRVVKGRRQQIDGVNTKVTAGQWHSLGLKAHGENFTIEFDGKTLFTTSDKTFAGAGKSRCGRRPTASQGLTRSLSMCCPSRSNANDIQMKPLSCDPARIKGMSERLIVSHYENNYGGAVKRLNFIEEKLAELTRRRPGRSSTVLSASSSSRRIR